MCVGCRKRAPVTELLRIVGSVQGGETVLLTPDPVRRRPGRGAHLHVDPACFASAFRRRAFGRALRVTGVTDASAVEAFINSKVGRPT